MTALPGVTSLFALMAAAVLGGPPSPAPSPPTAPAADLLASTRAVYAGLRSYADAGTVVDDKGGFVQRSRFRTAYRRDSRDFYFEYTGVATEYATGLKVPDANHMVLWMFHGNLETWNAVLRQHDSYPAGVRNQVSALVSAGAGTSGTAILIPSLLYAKAGLTNTIQEIAELSEAGTEAVAGHPCRKLTGVARSVYPTGQVTNVRAVTLWVDASTSLIRKVFTDTPQGMPIGTVSRLTVELDPLADPALPDSTFRFTIPSTQQ